MMVSLVGGWVVGGVLLCRVQWVGRRRSMGTSVVNDYHELPRYL